MTWHPPTDPLGLKGWGQRLDHFLVTPDFLSNKWKFTLDSVINFRGQGSSDHNPLMLTLRRPHELPCVQAVNSDVEIKNLDTLKTKTFRPAECPRITIEISGKPTQVFLDTGSPFSIYNPPPGNTTDDFYIKAAKPTGSKSNCSFTGATGGRVTAEQNYIMNFRAGNTSLAGEFVVLKQHAPNLPTFLVGMDILMTRLRYTTRLR